MNMNFNERIYSACVVLYCYRLHEFDEQVKVVREGMSKVVPVPLLTLFSGYELETLVCGSPDIPLALLKTVATYKGTELILRLNYAHLTF